VKFRKKPVVIEAIQFTGENYFEIEAFMDSSRHQRVDEKIAIDTLEGTMCALPCDWIIKGVAGEFYPCNPDIFVRTYEPVDACPHNPHPQREVNMATKKRPSKQLVQGGLGILKVQITPTATGIGEYMQITSADGFRINIVLIADAIVVEDARLTPQPPQTAGGER